MTSPQVDAGRELETVARLRLDGDWEGLIEWAKPDDAFAAHWTGRHHD